MNILIDANISWRICKLINQRFDICLHAKDLKVIQPAKDIDIWNFCNTNNFIIITHDEDFERLLVLKGFPPKIILLKTFNYNTNQIATLLLSKIEKIYDFYKDENQSILEIY